MMQRINLCNAITPQGSDPFTFERIQQLWLAFFAILLLIYMGGHWQRWQVASRIAQLRATERQALLHFEEVAKQFPKVAASEPLENAVIDLAKEVAAKENIVLSLTKTIERLGFSAYLQALGDFVPQGVWLNSININHGKGLIQLKGFALSPDLVPNFVSALAQAPVMKGKVFSHVKVEKPEANEGVIQFMVGTKENNGSSS